MSPVRTQPMNPRQKRVRNQQKRAVPKTPLTNRLMRSPPIPLEKKAERSQVTR